MSFFNFQPQNDMDTGREAIKYFHNKMVMLYPDQYTISMDFLINKVGGAAPNDFLDALGMAIKAIEMTSSQVEDAMEALADGANGGIPKQTKFFTALKDRAMVLTPGDWVEALPGIAADSAIDIAKGAQKVGDAVIDTGKSLLAIGPILIVGAVIFIVVMRSKQLAGA